MQQGYPISKAKIYATSMVMDTTGNYFISGIQRGDYCFGIKCLKSYKETQDAFILKLNPRGELQWLISATGPGTEYITTLAFNAKGELFAGGYFTSVVGGLSGTKLKGTLMPDNKSSKYNALLAKIDPATGKTLSTNVPFLYQQSLHQKNKSRQQRKPHRHGLV